jgi:hypothetical protein
MAKVTTIVSGGNPFGPSGMGSGTTTATSSASQTIQLAAWENDWWVLGNIKFWFAGNGVSSYLVNSARLIQGSRNIPIKMGGQQSFYVPPAGRYSDEIYIGDFTVPGTATVTITFSETVTLPTFSDNTVPEDPVIVSATEIYSPEWGEGLTGEVLFDVEFEGNFIDSINGLTPTDTTNFSIETNPAYILFGSGSGKFLGSAPEPLDPAYLIYALPADVKTKCLANGFTVSSFWALTTAFGDLPPYTKGQVAQVVTKDETDYVLDSYMNGSLMSSNSIDYASMSAMLDGFTLAFGLHGWVDGYQIINGQVWMSEFTPPSSPFTSTTDNNLIELTFNSLITVTENPSLGDTLVLKGGTAGDVTFTFVNYYPNNQYEIQIGDTVNDTATAMAVAISNIPGAEFVATVTDNIVTVFAYTTTFSTEETGSGLTLGAITHTLDGLITEDVSVADSFTAEDGGKAVQQNVSVADTIDGLIDGLSENLSASTEFDVPMDSIDENASVSTNFDGLIDMMGDSND